jgi:hypothetical protein
MADSKVGTKAQDAFLQQQRQAAPKLVIGSANTSSPTGIPAEGLTLKPAKRTKEEEERLAKTPSASMGGARVNKALTDSTTMVGSRSSERMR